jgi:hypothetical protein
LKNPGRFVSGSHDECVRRRLSSKVLGKAVESGGRGEGIDIDERLRNGDVRKHIMRRKGLEAPEKTVREGRETGLGGQKWNVEKLCGKERGVSEKETNAPARKSG